MDDENTLGAGAGAGVTHDAGKRTRGADTAGSRRAANLQRFLRAFGFRGSPPSDLEAAGLIAEQRRGLDRLGRADRVPSRFQVRFETVAGVPCQRIVPPAEGVLGGGGASRGQRPVEIVYLHGGGYVIGSLESHRGLAWRLARAAGQQVLQVGYRRAPETPFPGAYEDALAVCRSRARKVPLILAGDSAGGGLVFAVAAALRDDGAAPRGLVSLCPWVDLEGLGERAEELAVSDPLIDLDSMRWMGRLYAGEAVRDPRASPLHGSLAALPPALIQVSDREILLDDAVRLERALRRAGSSVTLETWPGMVHVWHLFGRWIDEADEALASVGRFCRERAASGPASG